MTTAREATNHLAELLRGEHHALAEFLIALSTFDAERRWVELGHRSLFHFITKELGLPNGPAYYRKTAAELIQRIPELVEPLRDGRLHLTSIVELSKVITPENRAEVLPRFFHKSKREAKEVLAALVPAAAPALRTVVTVVRPAAAASATAGNGPAALGGSLPGGAEPVTGVPGPGQEFVPALLPEEPVRANPTVHDVAPPPVPVPVPARASAPTSSVEPLTADLRRLHLTVSRRLLDKLAAARDALSHSHPGATEDEILEVGLDLILERHAKRRGLVEKPRDRTRSPGANVPAAEGERSRHVPAAVMREVWKRDGGKCAWPLEGGGICGSTRRVELDHIDGFALGGATTAARCRILCDFHQDVHARALYGDAVMDTYTRPKGKGCSEPVAGWGGAAGAVERDPRAPPTAPRRCGDVGYRRDRDRGPRPGPRRGSRPAERRAASGGILSS